MILGLAAVCYRAGQEFGYFPQDIYVFPFLVLFLWLLILLWVLSSDKLFEFYGRYLPDKRGFMTAVIVGSIIGAITGGAWWMLFESHKDKMSKLEAMENSNKTEPQFTDTTPIQKPSETVPPIHEEVEPIPSEKTVPRKATPPIIKKDIQVELKETIPAKPKEKLAAVLFRKYTALPPTIVAAPDRFIPTWIDRINIVRDDREKRHLPLDLQRLIREIGRPPIKGLTVKEFVDDAVAEATFTLRCLEREGYIQITETAAQGKWYAIGFPNWEFEFVPEKRDEFIAGL